MENYRLSFCFLILLFCNNITSHKYAEEDLYLIRSIASSLVLEVSGSKVVVQHFDGYKPQLWQFKRASLPGLFYIINNHTGTALDVADRAVIVAKENGSLKQQWILNANGHIVNAALNLNLDILNANFVPKNPLIVHPDNGCTCQDFIVKEKISCGVELDNKLEK